MKIKFIACRVLKNEIELAAEHSPHTIGYDYIEAGLHDRPGELRETLQAAINKSNEEEWDYLFVGYGLCGRGTIGITTDRIPLVIPRTHDCIALFLGSNREYFTQFGSCPGTYYLSASWFQEKALPQLSHKQSFLPAEDEFKHYAEKYGTENAEFIYDFFNRWRKNYKRVAFISTGVPKEDDYKSIAREFANAHNLQYEEIESEGTFILKSVNGDWDEQDFLILKPGYTTIIGEMNAISALPLQPVTEAEDEPDYGEVHRKRITLNEGAISEKIEIGLEP